jgi:hypothetical protein
MSGSEKFVFNAAELTAEKNLFDVYKKAKGLHRNKFNQFVTLLALAVFCSVSALALCGENFGRSEIVKQTYAIVDLMLNVSVSMLDFLLAGFTILATMSKTDMLMALAQVQYPKSNISYLKYSYFMFMRVMIYYFLMTVLCICIKFFGPVLQSVFRIVSTNEVENVKWVLSISIYIIIGTFTFYILSMLQSFIYNVYSVVMTMVRWEFEAE